MLFYFNDLVLIKIKMYFILDDFKFSIQIKLCQNITCNNTLQLQILTR